MKSEKDSQAELDNFLREAAVQNQMVTETSLPASVAHLFPDLPVAPSSLAQLPVSPTPTPVALDPTEQPLAVATTQHESVASSPAALPAAVAGPPIVQANDDSSTPSGKRPLTHFGQALPVTKSKANRKLVLQLTPEIYQYFAHVATLPGLDGVPLPDLVVAILHAWREDYRPEIKKANAAFKA